MDYSVFIRRLAPPVPDRYSMPMTKPKIVTAPAKINLHLAVGTPRSDGFHSIGSIFQAVSVYDRVSLEALDGGETTLECDCDCPVEKNTAWRAATAFLRAAAGRGVPEALAIAVEKGIPAGAGLGGGSSDAAATLTGLDRMFPGAVGRLELRRIAEAIGSDVPFFMDSACAAVSGRGERLAPIAPRVDYALVIVDPGFPISTKAAYECLDRARAAGRVAAAAGDEALDRELAAMVDAYERAQPSEWPFRNDFFDALADEYPALEACRADVLASGAAFASMSGSGSAVYGVFASSDHAERARAALSERYQAYAAFPLARLHQSI